MEHFYYKIDGWFNYQELYRKVIDILPDNAHIVEIGAWKGKSTAFLIVEMINSGKNIKLDVIDNWTGGTDAVDSYASDPDMIRLNNDIFTFFKDNLKSVEGHFTPHQMLSDEGAALFDNESLDFVFLDANHTYEFVKRDIAAWLPKIKKGGIFAGHDYNSITWEEVVKAVDETFSEEQLIIIDDCWMVIL